jgi:signal transduction histidine kinase
MKTDQEFINNSFFLFDILIFLFLGAAGALVNYIFYSRLLKIEESQRSKLESVNKKLESKVEGRTESLKLKNKELHEINNSLEKANSTKEDFMSTMNHEIRTPLNAIVGLIYLLSEKSPREDQIKEIEALRFSSQNLLSLVNNLLDTSKIEAGRIELDFESIALDSFLESIENTYRLQAKEKQIDFFVEEKNIKEECITTDPYRLSQIVTNLISNAIKFTDKGEVKMVCSQEEKGSQLYLNIAITDTGIGIPVEEREFVFKKFKQAHKRLSRDLGGAGLGLSIVYELVKILGGTLTLISEVGKGSEFCVCIPVEPSEKEGFSEDQETETLANS